jgi:hypothetical protein
MDPLSEAGTFFVLTILIGGASGTATGGLIGWYIRGRIEQTWKKELQDAKADVDDRLQRSKADLDKQLEEIRGLVQRRTAKLSLLDERRLAVLTDLYAELAGLQHALLYVQEEDKQSLTSTVRRIKQTFEAKAVLVPPKIERLVEDFLFASFGASLSLGVSKPKNVLWDKVAAAKQVATVLTKIKEAVRSVLEQ